VEETFPFYGFFLAASILRKLSSYQAFSWAIRQAVEKTLRHPNSIAVQWRKSCFTLFWDREYSTMNRRMKNVGLLVCGLGLLLLTVSTESATLRIAENLRREEVLLPHSAPERQRLSKVSFAAIVDEADIIGFSALYDDPRTQRSVDYIELYDPMGELLVICWLDSHGILRVAMDIGLLREEPAELEHILVLIEEGTAV
jgi:hypothetical protein